MRKKRPEILKLKNEAPLQVFKKICIETTEIIHVTCTSHLVDQDCGFTPATYRNPLGFRDREMSSYTIVSLKLDFEPPKGGLAVSAVWKLACLLSHIPIGTKEHAKTHRR
ncbi:MAG: hypothetical protein EBS96_12410, partial [Spartobacteria bacterium]|nr:hypothetical protein [Spartobacteria bacterium]